LVTAVRSWAADTWQRSVYRKVNHKMKLHNEEFEEEMDYLRNKTDRLKNLRKRLLTEKHD